MSYINAERILPEYLVKELQNYVDGQIIYVPRKDENLLSWGEKNGSRTKLAKRNQNIAKRYYNGESIEELSNVYFLSPKRIQGIIYEYEASKNDKENGEVQNES